MGNDQQSTDAQAKRRRRRTIGVWVKRLVLLLLAAAVLGAIVLAIVPRPLPVDTAVVRKGPMRAVISEDGKTHIEDRYVLSAPLTGTMSRIGLEPGDPVPEGSEVARIAPAAPALLDSRARAESEARLAAAKAGLSQSQAQIARAEAAADQADREAERLTKLVEKGAAAASELDQAQSEARARAEELRATRFGAKVAAEQVESARAALGLLGSRGEDALAIRSPVEGVVLRVLRRDEVGLVQAGAPLMEIGDPASMEVIVDVLTRDAVQIEPGQSVDLVRWGGDRTLEGVVTRIEPSAFSRISALGVEEQRVNVRIELLASTEEWRSLGDGYRIEAEIITWEGADVLTVPLAAIFRSGDGWAVFAVEEGKARITPIDIGHRGTATVEVTSGLRAGQEVILHPSDRVADGTSVERRRGATGAGG